MEPFWNCWGWLIILHLWIFFYSMGIRRERNLEMVSWRERGLMLFPLRLGGMLVVKMHWLHRFILIIKIKILWSLKLCKIFRVVNRVIDPEWMFGRIVCLRNYSQNWRGTLLRCYLFFRFIVSFGNWHTSFESY